jgi:hypothetical protein
VVQHVLYAAVVGQSIKEGSDRLLCLHRILLKKQSIASALILDPIAGTGSLAR